MYPKLFAYPHIISINHKYHDKISLNRGKYYNNRLQLTIQWTVKSTQLCSGAIHLLCPYGGWYSQQWSL